MSPPLHPRDGEAAEYVLGTLSADERAAFRRDMAADSALAAAVQAWERRLARLTAGTAPVEPDPQIWLRINAALDVEAAARTTARPSAGSTDLSRLRRSRALWRAGALVGLALAASLAFVVGFDRLAPPPAPVLLAAVNASGEAPALLVRIDPATGIVQVRSLAPAAPAGRTNVLWSIAPGGTPKLIGRLDGGGDRIAAPAGSVVDGATVAVSVEPGGALPTGGPTGPVIYSGKLVPEPR